MASNVKLTRLKVRRIPFGDVAEDEAGHRGSFYPSIDGKAWSENGRAFWPTRAEAMQAGMRIFDKILREENAAAGLEALREVEGR